MNCKPDDLAVLVRSEERNVAHRRRLVPQPILQQWTPAAPAPKPSQQRTR